MGKCKYVMSWGLAFFEKRDMAKLKVLANAGWRLDRFVGIWYRLKKEAPENLDFSLDYCPMANSSQRDKDEYLEIFKSGGWKLETTVGEMIHIFSAQEGTEPIYTDKLSEIEKFQGARDQFRTPAIISSLFFVLVILLNLVTKSIEYQIHTTISVGLLVLGLLAVVPMIFTGMPFIAFEFTLKKLRRR